MGDARRVLITGGSGFVGQWLARELLDRGHRVVAGSITGPPELGVLDPAMHATVRWVPLDVTVPADLDRVVSEVQPDWVVHLAGIAFPPEANADPGKAFAVNALGALHLLTAITRHAAGARVLVVGSADQYGPQSADRYPLSEDVPQQPRSAYGASKAAQEIIALQMHRGAGLHVVCTRSFNHSGVGHPTSYLLPALVERAAALPARGGTLVIGNAEPTRDYLHVLDVVDAYIRLLEQGVPGGVYNVCSGQGITVRELAGRVLERFGRDADVSSDPALFRPSDMPMLVGSNARLRADTGWSPRRSIDDIIDDLIHAAAH